MDCTITPARPRARSRHRRKLVARFFAAMALHQQRRDLARLSARLLRDIGVSRAAASAEAQRPVWNAPDRWRK